MISSLASKSLLAGAAALALSAAGCAERLDPSSRVVDIRVLAVQADQPYAHPGDVVQLDALGVDPEGRQLTWGWATCENPEDTTALACLNALQRRAADGEDVQLTTGVDLNRFQVAVDESVITSLPDNLQSRALIGVVAVLCPGTLEPQILAATSNDHPIPVTCRDADSGQRIGPFGFVTGVKRLFVRREDRNENPTIDDVTLDGEPWAEDDVPTVSACDVETNAIDDCPESTHHTIAARPPNGVVESGVTEYGEAFDEQVVIQYYATAGTFDDEVRIASAPETKWAASPTSKGGEQTFWFVIRDNRGGVSWISRRLRVEG